MTPARDHAAGAMENPYVKADKLLERLRDPAALAGLAEVVVEDLLATPVRSLIDPDLAAPAIRALLRSWAHSDEAEAQVLARIEEARSWLEKRDAVVADLIPEELQNAVAALAERPFAPDRAILLALLDREPVRRLLRNLLTESLVAFGRKLRAPVADNRLARGLGDLGRFARDTALGRSGSFGAIASEVVGAVSGEVERQLEKRAAEFADAALSGTLQRIADLLCDSELADEQAELRLALIDGALELSAGDLASEAERLDPAAISAIVRRWFTAWVDREDVEAKIAQALEAWLAPAGERTVREILAEHGMLDAVLEAARKEAERRLSSLVGRDAFAAWLAKIVG